MLRCWGGRDPPNPRPDAHRARRDREYARGLRVALERPYYYMGSALDEAITRRLLQLPSAAPEEESSIVFKRASDIVTRLAIDHAFRERLVGPDAALLGCSKHGKLTRAGRRLSALTFDEYSRVETRQETNVHARATLHRARLTWEFSSDHNTAQFTLRRAAAPDPHGPDVELIHVRVRRQQTGNGQQQKSETEEGQDEPQQQQQQQEQQQQEEGVIVVDRVVASIRGLTSLDRRLIGSGLDAGTLCHCLIGLLPETYGEEWDVYEKIVDCVMRYQARGDKRERLAGRWWVRRDRWWRRRLRG